MSFSLLRRARKLIGDFPVSRCGSQQRHSSHTAPSVKARWDYKALRAEAEYHRQNIRDRQAEADIDRVVELYEQCSATRRTLDGLRHRRNQISSTIGRSSKEEIEALKEESKALKQAEKEAEEEAARLSLELEVEALKVPNRTHPEVPVGTEEGATKVLREINQKPAFTFPPKDHLQLGKELDLIDLESGADVAGHRFAVLKNEAALLELALSLFAIGKLREKGWTIVLPPDLVRHYIVEGCGFQPRGESTQFYSLEGSDLFLAGTSELSLAGMKAGKILREDELPLRLAALSHCFRTEAGARGRGEKGLYRLHQFTKVEMFSFCTPAQSEQLHEEMLAIEEEIYSELDLHFKVCEMPTGDLGAPAYRKYDILAWLPSRGSFGEISSTSNCTDYQARRLNIRYRAKEDKSLHFVHTVNGTAVAVPRLLVALLEGNQQEDGSVIIPRALRPFMWGQERITPKKK